MDKITNTTSDDIRVSVASIYSDLLEKRRLEREAKEEKKRQEREARQREKEEKESSEDGSKKSKKEKRAVELDNWKEVIVGLTGDDLEYSDEKKSKKKYRKWIDDEDGKNVILSPKPKKAKKQNYQKQFDPELQMLKAIVADQNRFTSDLQKRFNIAAGPATKDAQLPNKTLVELASVINAGRSNSLGVLREIGNLKKTIADLYMKQKKMEADAGAGFNTTDIGLMGSNIASSIFSDSTPAPQQSAAPMESYVQPSTQNQPASAVTAQPQTEGGQPVIQIEAFDPASWGGPSLPTDSMTRFEGKPVEVVVELDKSTNSARFKAINTEDGSEVTNYPVPTSDVSRLSINEKDGYVKGEFDESYKLHVI